MKNRQSGGTIGVTVALLVIVCGIMMVTSIYIYTSIRISSNKISRVSNELLIKNYSYNYLASLDDADPLTSEVYEVQIEDIDSTNHKITITEINGNNKVVIEYIKDGTGYEILSYKFN